MATTGKSESWRIMAWAAAWSSGAASLRVVTAWNSVSTCAEITQ